MALGFEAAKQAVLLGRGAFFPNHGNDLPHRQSSILNEYDLIPQFVFLGRQYESKCVLLLGINPGNGPDDRRTREDERMMPMLKSFFTIRRQRILSTRRKHIWLDVKIGRCRNGTVLK